MSNTNEPIKISKRHRKMLEDMLSKAYLAAYGDSNDSEISAWREAATWGAMLIGVDTATLAEKADALAVEKGLA